MKSTMKYIAFCALVGAASSAHATVVLINNGDFSTAGGAEFGSFASGGTVISFPATGGNPGGYGEIDNTAGAWGGGLVSPPDGAPANGTPLGDYGLVAGESYVFSMDLKTFSGGGTGGLKLESWNESGLISATADMAASGTSGVWETYTWTYTIDPGATRIKVVPLLTGASGGGNSLIGYDNISVDNTPIFVPPPPLVPNPGFEDTPAGVNWTFISSGAQTVTFPTTGGNPDGHAVIDQIGFSPPGDWAILVWNNNAFKSLASLGMTAGETYTFKVDMKIISGTQVGGIKLDYSPGSTGDIFPTATIGDGSTWETYNFDIAIPIDATQINLVLVGRPGSEVAFDNVEIIIPEPVPLIADINQGTVVSWTADPANNYQAQESTDNATWVDLGPLYNGDAVASTFDADGSPFYQVLEIGPDILDNSVLNGGFETTETATYPSPGAQDWVIQSPEDTDPADGTATMTNETSYLRASDSMTFTPFEGAQMLVIESTTPAVGVVSPPNTNVASVQFFVDPSTDLNVSFMAAHVVKNGGANPQYQVTFFDDGGGGAPGFISNSGFQPFATIGDTWTKVELPVTTPANAQWMTIEFIQAMGAGNGWQWTTLIDDVSIPYVVSAGPSTPIAATSTDGVEISWPTEDGTPYQVKSSTDAIGFSDFGPSRTGDGGTGSATDVTGPGTTLYRVIEGP